MQNTEEWKEIVPHGLCFKFVDQENCFCHYEKCIDHRFKRENDKIYYNVNDKQIIK